MQSEGENISLYVTSSPRILSPPSPNNQDCWDDDPNGPNIRRMGCRDCSSLPGLEIEESSRLDCCHERRRIADRYLKTPSFLLRFFFTPSFNLSLDLTTHTYAHIIHHPPILIFFLTLQLTYSPTHTIRSFTTLAALLFPLATLAAINGPCTGPPDGKASGDYLTEGICLLVGDCVDSHGTAGSTLPGGGGYPFDPNDVTCCVIGLEGSSAGKQHAAQKRERISTRTKTLILFFSQSLWRFFLLRLE